MKRPQFTASNMNSFGSFRKWKHALFICCSNDYRLSRLLHARTELWMPMDYVVRWLPTFRGKNNRTLLNVSLRRNRDNIYHGYVISLSQWFFSFTARQIHHQLFMKFDKGIEKMRDYINNTKKHLYLVGVLQASKVFICAISNLL